MTENRYNKILITALFFLAVVHAKGQSDSVAFVNIQKIYSEYQPLIQAQEKLNIDISNAKQIMKENIKRSDSVFFHENLIAKNQDELNAGQQQVYETQKKQMHKEQFKKIEKVLLDYRKKVSPIEKKIISLAEELKSEVGYKSLKYIKNGEDSVGQDITNLIIDRLNQ